MKGLQIRNNDLRNKHTQGSTNTNTNYPIIVQVTDVNTTTQHMKVNTYTSSNPAGKIKGGMFSQRDEFMYKDIILLGPGKDNIFPPWMERLQPLPNLLKSKRQTTTIVCFRRAQAKEILSGPETTEWKSRADTATQVLGTYYQQPLS